VTKGPVPATRVSPYAYAAGRLRLLDQRRLPHEEAFLECESAAQTAEAIRGLAVRGAPLIGVAAAYGLCAEARRVAARVPEDLDVALKDRRARRWCKDAARLSGRDWAYEKVPQRLFDSFNGDNVEALRRFLDASSAGS